MHRARGNRNNAPRRSERHPSLGLPRRLLSSRTAGLVAKVHYIYVYTYTNIKRYTPPVQRSTVSPCRAALAHAHAYTRTQTNIYIRSNKLLLAIACIIRMRYILHHYPAHHQSSARSKNVHISTVFFVLRYNYRVSLSMLSVSSRQFYRFTLGVRQVV